jgi:exosome complex component RRP43
MKFRPIILNVNSIETANGSAIVKIGNTTVVCGIKAELAPPKAKEPEYGFITPNIEMTPLCSSKYRPGPPSEDAQILRLCLYDVLVNSELIDLKTLQKRNMEFIL